MPSDGTAGERPGRRSAAAPGSGGHGERRKRPEVGSGAGGSGGDRTRSVHRRAQRAGPPDPVALRLQKILSAAGVASRREAEKLIAAGRVRVNEETVTELGTR